MDETILLVFMYVLIGFIVVLTILGILLMIFLKVILSALSRITENLQNEEAEETAEQDEETAAVDDGQEPEQQTEPEPEPQDEENGEEVSATQDDEETEPEQEFIFADAPQGSDEDESAFVTEKHERIRYDRSCMAKICQMKNETKSWYSELKNELLSYENVKSRWSWRYETFRLRKTNVARFMVRGKTLCLLLATQPSDYTDTKFTVEDVSNNVTMADTPTLYRIKSIKRVKYAKEMIEDIMKKNQAFMNPKHMAKDYFMPYEGDMTLMKRGLVKRVVNNSTRKYKIEEINDDEDSRTDD